jgi:hypothetical protein
MKRTPRARASEFGNPTVVDLIGSPPRLLVRIGCGSLDLKLSFHASGAYMLLLLLRLLTPSEEAIQDSADRAPSVGRSVGRSVAGRRRSASVGTYLPSVGRDPTRRHFSL